MAEILFIPATQAHAEAMAPSMRPEDLAEVSALGYTAIGSLRRSLLCSEHSWAALVDGEVAALFGVCQLAPGRGCVWLLTASVFLKHARRFARVAKSVLAEMLAQTGVLENYVDARYESAIRWVKWLGFEVLPAEPLGPLGLPFHPVVIRRA